MTLLKVTFDGESPRFRLIPYADILQWRKWSDRENEILRHVMSGEVRRFSTRNDQGVFCDVELPNAAELEMAS